MKLQPGSPAPDFRALDQEKNEHSLSDYRGQYLLLYFYPKDDTPGCTAQACGLRDVYGELKKHAALLGVSADSVESHEAFAKKYALPFPLLADPEKNIIQAYGVDGLLFSHRSSFLIDPQGTIAKVYDNVDPDTHADMVLRDIITLS